MWYHAEPEIAPKQEPTWLILLGAEAKKTSITQVAKRLGYSRTSISLALAGKYPGSLRLLEHVVLATLGSGLSKEADDRLTRIEASINELHKKLDWLIELTRKDKNEEHPL